MSTSLMTLDLSKRNNPFISGVDYPTPWYYSTVSSASSPSSSSAADVDNPYARASSSDNSPVVISRESQLTSSPDCRTNARPHTLPPSPQTQHRTFPKVAISAFNTRTYTTQRQDVRHILVNNSASSSTSSTAPRYNVPTSSTPLESPQLSSFASSHGSLNTPSHRPRSSNKVFSSTQDLAKHYGIPQILPPAPRTTPHRQQPPQQPPSPFPDFAALRANYLNMLSHNTMTEDSTTSVPSSTVAPADIMSSVTQSSSTEVSDDMRDLLETLLGDFPSPASSDSSQMAYYPSPISRSASPEFQTSPEFSAPALPSFDVNEYLTSPMETPYDDFNSSPLDDSPFSDFLNTPLLPDSDGADMLTSPLIDQHGYEGMSLFGDMSMYSYETTSPAAPAQPKLPAEDLYTISPSTPSLDPASIYPSPSLNQKPSPSFSEPALPSSTTKRRVSSQATGTRKNITPAALVPLDAPTQPRKYTMPSATSRKEVPAVWAKKRAHSVAFEDDEELGELPPNATEKEQIEFKRRQNTLAARKSRKRKLEHTQGLENQVEDLKRECGMWETRARMLANVLASNGIPFDGEWEEE